MSRRKTTPPAELTQSAFRGALDAVPSHVAILDADGTILFVNRAWRKFGDDNGLALPNACVGRNYVEAWAKPDEPTPPEARVARERLTDIMAARTNEFTLEYPCHSPDVQRWFIMRAARFRYDGTEGIIVEHTDISERRLAEDALRTSHAELEAFTASASHDLRAPLRRMEDLATTLAAEPDLDAAEARAILSHVQAEASRARALVHDLMALSRVAGADVARADVDLTALVQQVIDELRTLEPTRRIETRVDPGMRVRGDPALLRIALHNLIGNAWKFTARRDDPRIDVGVERHDGATLYYVRDNGVGFAAGEAEELFNPFSRLPSAAGFEGTGVGLATVRRIVERHGGRVWAAGVAGEGATFRFTLEP